MSEAMGLGLFWEVKDPKTLITIAFCCDLVLFSVHFVLEDHPMSWPSWQPQDLTWGYNMPGVAWDRASCLFTASGTLLLYPDLKLGQVAGVCVWVLGWTGPLWTALLF